jgi:hypothetical protein
MTTVLHCLLCLATPPHPTYMNILLCAVLSALRGAIPWIPPPCFSPVRAQTIVLVRRRVTLYVNIPVITVVLRILFIIDTFHTLTPLFSSLRSCALTLISFLTTLRRGAATCASQAPPLHVTECFHDVDHLEALPLIDIEFSHHYFIGYNSNICKYSLLDPSEDMPCCLSTPAGVFPDATSFTTGLGWLSSIPEGLEQSTVLALCQCSVRVRCSSCSSVLLIEPCECCECGASTFDVVLQCVCECCVHVPGSKVVLDSCPEACCLSSFCVCFDPGQSLT